MTDAENPLLKMVTQVRLKIRDDIYQGTLNYESATSTLNRYLDVAKKMNDLVLVGQIYETLGTIEVERSNYKQGYQLYEQSIDAFRKANDSGRVGVMLNNLGEVHRRVGNFEEALRYYSEARQASEASGRQSTVISTYNNEGQVRLALGQIDEAIAIFNEGLRINSDSGQWSRTTLQSTLPEIHSKLAEAHALKQDFAVAWQNAQRALEISEAYNQFNQLAQAYQAMAFIAMRDSARHDQCPDLFRKSRTYWERVHATVELGRLYDLEGDYWHGQANQIKANQAYQKAVTHLEKGQLVKEAQQVRNKIDR